MPILELHPKTILAVGAHADDIEFWYGATLAKWIAAGAHVYLLVLTNGDKGSADPEADPAQVAATRRAEQRSAAQALGAAGVFFGNIPDCELEYHLTQARREVIRTIRRVKPDVVIGWDPTFVYSAAWQLVNHLDHRAAGTATLDAVYPLARDPLTYPDLGEPHLTPTLLLINPDRADHFSDVTAHLDAKLAALGAHATQVGLIAEKPVLDRLHASGQSAGLKVVESFIRLDFA